MNQWLKKIKLIYGCFIVCFALSAWGQNIALYEQFEGRYNFTFIGNTLNPNENSFMPAPAILSSSSAELNLQPNDQITKAYLYWAGCGTGDSQITLNGTPYTAIRNFSYQRNVQGTILDYFSAFADVTTQLQNTGNGTYTFADLDLSAWIDFYYNFTNTNFGGWAIVVVYENPNLPLNQVNLYDGLQAIPNAVNLVLDNLDVTDTNNAQIGFLAWEGDRNIAEGESLYINNNLIGAPPLNPNNNAFNGTNSITGSAALYNMDMDIYSLQGNIQLGDTTLPIRLTSSRDFVMINAVVTQLNQRLPDATITVDLIESPCNFRDVKINYTVHNTQGTLALPAQTPIAVFVGGTYLTTSYTQSDLAPGQSEPGVLQFILPDGLSSPFAVQMMVDQDTAGNGTVTELDEQNNDFQTTGNIGIAPELVAPADLVVCNEGNFSGTFDFSGYVESLKQNPTDEVRFYNNLDDLNNNTHQITQPDHYFAEQTPKTIYIKVGRQDCYQQTSLVLRTRKCPPVIYNFISANQDGVNDTFHIDHLYHIFNDFKMYIYNRWGKLVWTGDNQSAEWDGVANQGLIVADAALADGTYYYVLELNDPDYPEPMTGYLYLTHP